MSPLIKKIFVAMLPLATVAVVVMLVTPEYQRIGEARREKETAEIQLADKRTLVAKIKSLESQYREVEEETKKAAEIVPLDPSIPSLLVEIPALVVQHGMILEKIAFGTTKEAESRAFSSGPQQAVSGPLYRSMPVELGLKGTYESFKVFLKALETDLRLMDVATIRFGGLAEGSGIGTFDVSADVYYGLSL